MLAGRPVELHHRRHRRQSGGVPHQDAGAGRTVQRVLLLGPLAAFEALAIDDYIRSTQDADLTVAGAEDMTQRKANPCFMRPGSTSAQRRHPIGDYADKDLKLKRVATIADDFAFGHENVGGFLRGVRGTGGKVVQKLWTPLNAADYGTYISQLKPNLDARVHRRMPDRTA